MLVSERKSSNDLITREELVERAARIDAQLVNLTKELERQRDEIAQIKDRGLIARITQNNTRDLAEILMEQNRRMEEFLALVQSEVKLIRESIQSRNEFFDPIEIDGHLKESRTIGSIALVCSSISLLILIVILIKIYL
ncbi:MAG: hypothetical protein IJ575_07355 [Selenomonadaceae bacterium]|nr:hypothetical protein [Selenomonadaceae bacterium]